MDQKELLTSRHRGACGRYGRGGLFGQTGNSMYRAARGLGFAARLRCKLPYFEGAGAILVPVRNQQRVVAKIDRIRSRPGGMDDANNLTIGPDSDCPPAWGRHRFSLNDYELLPRHVEKQLVRWRKRVREYCGSIPGQPTWRYTPGIHAGKRLDFRCEHQLAICSVDNLTSRRKGYRTHDGTRASIVNVNSRRPPREHVGQWPSHTDTSPAPKAHLIDATCATPIG